MATYSHLSTVSPTLPELSHDPRGIVLDDWADTLFATNESVEPGQTVSHVLTSLTSPQQPTHQYDLVEDDDYDQSQITPKLPHTAVLPETTNRPFRTASISRHLPMHNPVPDLQSLQGAYLKNVERLEDHAERISLAESMEEELERMKQEMKRSESLRRTSTDRHTRPRNTSQPVTSNLITTINAAARAGAVSSADLASPIASLHSPRHSVSQRMSRSNFSMLEPQLEGRPLDSTMTNDPPTHAAHPYAFDTASPRQSSHYERPTTADSRASNDTYRQAQNLFTDFDGTHRPALGEMDPSSRRVSLYAPPLARDSRAFKEPQPGEQMVYYPAPVPVMLNLPQRLSKMSWTDREKRRLQGLSNIPDEMRKSAIWLNGVSDTDVPKSRPTSMLPPQLRASAFFDQPSQTADVKLKHGSAVLTLDSILDAAAHAPVSAFTDHPIVGQLGQEVYGASPKKETKPDAKKRRSTLSNILTRRSSQNLNETLAGDGVDQDQEGIADRSLMPGEDEAADDGEQVDREEDDGEAEADQHQLGFLGAPTTLLAELQMRKAQQKLRNRTAANAFPNGMHSTLLELDVVAQLQQKARKQKHVALAWEDQEAIERENNDDEDVPLGVLFPEKNKQTYVNQHRPLGLMERKELEENEPLSSRRARLRGEPLQPVHQPDDVTPTVNLPMGDSGLEEQEEETLAQRRIRLAAQTDKKEQDVGDDVAVEPGVDAGELRQSHTTTPEVEETLGQRRKRLQEEREAAVRAGATLEPRTSMGDLLRAHPVGSREDAAPRTGALLGSTSVGPLVEQIQDNPARPTQLRQQSRYGIPPPYYPSQPLLGHGMQAGRFDMQYAGQALQTPPLPQYQAMPMPLMQPVDSFQPTSPFGASVYGMPGYNAAMTSGMVFGGGYPQMAMPTQYMMTGYGMNGMSTTQTPVYDVIGSGPPLDRVQRENIMKWRSNVT